jgi:hypothetical protein
VSDREPTPEERGVDPAASAMGKKGGTSARGHPVARAVRGNRQESRLF